MASTPVRFKKAIRKLARDSEKACSFIQNLEIIANCFSYYHDNTPSLNEIFNKAYSKDFVHYYLESYLQKPPGVVFRYIAELQYVVESIDNSGMMYRRATCLTMDPKEVDIRKWIKESRKKFSSRDSRVFKEEIMSSTDISESDKKKACENLDSFSSILGNIRENVHVCCYSDDFCRIERG